MRIWAFAICKFSFLHGKSRQPPSFPPNFFELRCPFCSRSTKYSIRTHTCICPLPPLTGHAHLQRCLPSHATRIPTRPILTYPLFLTFFSSALAALAALAALVGIAAQPRLASLTHYVHHAQVNQCVKLGYNLGRLVRSRTLTMSWPTDRLVDDQPLLDPSDAGSPLQQTWS